MTRPWQVGDIVRREWPSVSTGGKVWIETGMVTMVDETGGRRLLGIGPIKFDRPQEWLEKEGWKLVEGEVANG
jgi:hypothetical protein